MKVTPDKNLIGCFTYYDICFKISYNFSAQYLKPKYLTYKRMIQNVDFVIYIWIDSHWDGKGYWRSPVRWNLAKKIHTTRSYYNEASMYINRTSMITFLLLYNICIGHVSFDQIICRHCTEKNIKRLLRRKLQLALGLDLKKLTFRNVCW